MLSLPFLESAGFISPRMVSQSSAGLEVSEQNIVSGYEIVIDAFVVIFRISRIDFPPVGCTKAELTSTSMKKEGF